jgi:hypothetical protein
LVCSWMHNIAILAGCSGSTYERGRELQLMIAVQTTL